MGAFEFGSLLRRDPPPPPGDIMWYKAHGLMMYTAFAILFPVGVFGVRYGRYHARFAHWFQYHWALQSLGVFMTTGGISVALRNFENTRYSDHRSIGLFLTFFALLQPVLAIFRPEAGDPLRRYWEFSHWFLGTGGIVLGWVNVFKGLDMYFFDWPEAGSQLILTVLFSCQVTMMGFAYLLFDRCQRPMPPPPIPPPVDDSMVPLLMKSNRSQGEKQFLTNV